VVQLGLVRRVAFAYMTPETWAKFAPFAATLSNAIGTLIFLIGAVLRTRFRFVFSVNAAAALLFTLSTSYWLVVSLQQTYGMSLLSREALSRLFPVQALCAYTAVPLGLIGIAMLVWQARRCDRDRHT
jgi:hypothetical protein